RLRAPPRWRGRRRTDNQSRGRLLERDVDRRQSGHRMHSLESADRPALGVLVPERDRWARDLGRDAVASRILRVRNHGNRFDHGAPEPDKPDAGGDPRRRPPMAPEHVADHAGPRPSGREHHLAERRYLRWSVDRRDVVRDGLRDWNRSFELYPRLERGRRADLDPDRDLARIGAELYVRPRDRAERESLFPANPGPGRWDAVALQLRHHGRAFRDRPARRRHGGPAPVGRKRADRAAASGGRPPLHRQCDRRRSVSRRIHHRRGGALPSDEGLYGGTTEYRVLRATSPRGPYADVSGAILGNGSASYEFVDPARGADASDYFYRIETVDAATNAANSTSLLVKVHLAFAAGLNLLGMPVDLTDPTFGDLVAGRAWADAWTYDACSGGFGWSSAIPSDPSTFALPKGRGFWLNGSAADSITL